MPDAVKLGQDTRTSFASSLLGGFYHPIKKTVETMQVIKRGMQIKETTVYGLEAVFVPPWLIDEYGCIRIGSRAVRKVLLGMHYFQEAAQSHIPMEEEMCPPCEYSLKRTSTNLIEFWWRTLIILVF